MYNDRFQSAKDTVRALHRALDGATDKQLESTLALRTAPDFLWRGMHPFHEQTGAAAVTTIFWQPLRAALRHLQRRDDIFFAGRSSVSAGGDVWVASMGHLMGLFDRPWLGIPATGKLTMLRYAEFNRVADGVVCESALFCDIIGVMQQAGHNPLPPQTGAAFVHPAPRGHGGLLHAAQDPAQGARTLALVDRMIDDLSALNESGDDRCPPEYLARTWHDDMAWYGPAGIGSTYTIERYQKQHQYPFRTQLKNKVFNGHVARIAEGDFAGFFGWPNLTNTATGGFLGLPGNDVRADMRVVDIYRRDGDKLAENWVFIDLPHYLNMQGLDILGRLEQQQS